MIVTSNQNLSPKIIESVNNQVIYWSDDRNLHWFFDYKLDGKWISSININNELTHCKIEIY